VLLVRDGGPVRTVADLRGRRVALGEGSYQTTLLAFALDGAGLSYADVETVDARREGGRLLAAGEVDAWVGGDPELAAAQRAGGVRELVDTASVHSNRSVWFARRAFAEEHPERLDAIVTALQRSDAWIAEHPREAAEIFARDVPDSPPVDVWEDALRRRPWGPRPLTRDFVEEQQAAADLLARAGILPARIVVEDAVTAPTPALA
jgi:sulfonate transport system substrate-binding protein